VVTFVFVACAPGLVKCIIHQTGNQIHRNEPVKMRGRLEVMKNWEPFVFGPVFAINSTPRSSWSKTKFSSEM
jgi:hypothetical protein